MSDSDPAADYFDGRRARASRVRLSIVGNRLRIAGDGIERLVALTDIEWPERQRHGGRVAILPDGAALHGLPGEPWDAWLRDAGLGDSLVVRAQQNWRNVGLAVIAMILLLIGGWWWGVPLASRGILAFVPQDVDRALGDQVAQGMVGPWLSPTGLGESRRRQISDAFAAAVRSDAARTSEKSGRPTAPQAYDLRFHKSRLGPNALALPGGIIVLTDEMVALADKAGTDSTAMLVGVLGHELGHVQRRHGMRGLVQATLVGTAAAIALGDFSSLLAAAPALLAQQGYSRAFEREADSDSLRILLAAGHPPAVMARFFELVKESRKDPPVAGAMQRIAIALSSHPADEERIRYFREAGAVAP